MGVVAKNPISQLMPVPAQQASRLPATWLLSAEVGWMRYRRCRNDRPNGGCRPASRTRSF
jgi:hypothetical protein